MISAAGHIRGRKRRPGCWIEMNRQRREATLGLPSHLKAEGGTCLATGLGTDDHNILTGLNCASMSP